MSKAPAKPAAEEAAPAGKSKKMLFIIIGAVVVILAGGGAAAWFMTRQPSAHHEEKAEPPKPPVYVALDSFTVNLAPDDGAEGDKYLQTILTLQVHDEKEAEEMKLRMPQIRSRILLLLSSKKASELAAEGGKIKLAKDIMDEVNKPFEAKAESQKVTSVFFTSLVIQ